MSSEEFNNENIDRIDLPDLNVTVSEETPFRKKISRRQLFRLGFYSLPALAIFNGFVIEPNWLKLKSIFIGNNPKRKVVHFSDLHYRGDQKYLTSIIKMINGACPDFVCFTGDIVENKKFLKEALDGISQINAPVYGVPGNHDYWSQINFSEVEKVFRKTGGEWIMDKGVMSPDKSIFISGVTSMNSPPPPEADANLTHIVLAHYPAYVDKLPCMYDLILAGHSHGGQVRIPFYGALLTPFDTGKYEVGLFDTDAGPLYVSPGTGYWFIPVRFFCRPEITVIYI